MQTQVLLILIYHLIFLITKYEAHIAEKRKVTHQISETPFNKKLTIYDVNLTASNKDFFFQIRSLNESIPLVSSRDNNGTDGIAHWNGNFTLFTENTAETRVDLEESRNMNINIHVKKVTSLHETIFQLACSAIILFMFINLGTVLDLKRLKSIVLFPIGPAVAFTSRYIIMPVIGLVFGLLLFPEDKNLQLAVFYSMLSPSGGVANICNFLMRGNIDLSIAATTLNSLMTLAMFPIWIVLLGSVVYKRTGLVVPYMSLAISFLGILFALLFGVTMRFCFPKATIKITRFLKPLSVVLSLLLVVVTVVVHIITFRYFTLLMGITAIILPLISYFLTYGLSKLTFMESNDAMTISLEIGVMNMTVPTLLLNASLQTVEANKVLALPITCALISLIYVALFYLKRRFYGWPEKIDTITKTSVTEQL